MMTVKLRVFLIVLFVVLLIWIIRQVQKRKLDLRYTLTWFLLDVVLMLLAIFPNILNVISRFFGIYSPVNTIFFCGFVFSLLIIYTLTVAVSKLTEEVKRLSQSIALLDHEIKKHQNADGED